MPRFGDSRINDSGLMEYWDGKKWSEFGPPEDWAPTAYDIAWTKGLLDRLKIGGVWGTSYAVYRKTGEKTMSLDMVIIGLCDAGRMLERTKKAIIASGYTLEGIEDKTGQPEEKKEG